MLSVFYSVGQSLQGVDVVSIGTTEVHVSAVSSACQNPAESRWIFGCCSMFDENIKIIIIARSKPNLCSQFWHYLFIRFLIFMYTATLKTKGNARHPKPQKQQLCLRCVGVLIVHMFSGVSEYNRVQCNCHSP